VITITIEIKIKED
uniref:Uncharacterized protein n=1 Tax=Amphimedon queenslandica TaxID=400682 RepID=A0A1X7UQP6_AMPQE